MWRQHVPYTTFNMFTGQVLIKKQASEYNGFIFCLLSFWEAQFFLLREWKALVWFTLKELGKRD